MQKDILISQRLVYNHLMQSKKEEVVSLYIRKKAKRPGGKKEARVESEKDLKRKHMAEEIENVKRQKMAVEKSVETLCKAIPYDCKQEHALKAASFAKTLIEKESMLGKKLED